MLRASVHIYKTTYILYSILMHTQHTTPHMYVSTTMSPWDLVFPGMKTSFGKTHHEDCSNNNALCKLDLGMWTCSRKRFRDIYIKCATRITICRGWKRKALWKGGSEWLVRSIARNVLTMLTSWKVGSTLWYACRVYQHSKMWLNSRHFVWEGSQHGHGINSRNHQKVHPSIWTVTKVICCI